MTLAICGSATPSVSSETASTSRLIHSACRSIEIGVRLRQRHGDPVRELEPLLLAHPVQGVDQVVDTPLELELGVEGRVERHGDAFLRGDGPAFLAGALDEDLVGTEVVAENAEAAALELLEIARGECLAHRAEFLAEPRAERRQVRLHVQLGRLDGTEQTSLTRNSSRNSTAWAAARGAPSTTRRRNGCRSFNCEAART